MRIHIPNECLQEVFKHLDENDTKTLFSILLVNRLWCQNIVSILWKNPFNFNKSKFPFKMNLILLSYTDEEPINPLKESNLFYIPKVTTFNYPSLIKQLDITSMYQSIRLFVKELSKFDIKIKRNIIMELLWQIIIKNSRIETFIMNDYIELYKILLETPGTKDSFSSLKKLHCNLHEENLLILGNFIKLTNNQFLL